MIFNFLCYALLRDFVKVNNKRFIKMLREGTHGTERGKNRLLIGCFISPLLERFKVLGDAKVILEVNVIKPILEGWEGFSFFDRKEGKAEVDC